MDSIPFLDYPTVAEKALDFLRQYWPEDEIPVDIERIVEFGLGMDIVPIPRLQQDHNIEGFTASDFSRTYVDEYVLTAVPVRYRFTLAHEVGHCVLHREFIEQYRFDSVEEWKRFFIEVDGQQYSWMEWQGYSFAGLVLVPPHHLRRYFDENYAEVASAIEDAKRAGFRRSDYLEPAKEMMAAKLAPMFNVSQQVVIKRIDLDNLDRSFP